MSENSDEPMAPPSLVKKRSKIEATGLRLEKTLSKASNVEEEEDEDEEMNDEEDEDSDEKCPNCGLGEWDCPGHDEDDG